MHRESDTQMAAQTIIASSLSALRTEDISQSLPVPEDKIGWIVGKKGSYINQLVRKSGATIAISESTSKEFGIVWKYVQLSGSGRAIDKAKKLIHLRLSRLETKLALEDLDKISEEADNVP